ncbi:MAG TPA: hypothetical protein VE422_40690 [Terriglobia bacterium]|nr:hypothetical protein [Terriglobia bacterium]
MVILDRTLIAEARRLITGANVHQMKMRIFIYEEAVQLHNTGHPRHRIYHYHYENLLRQYVATAVSARLMLEEARRVSIVAQETREHSERLKGEMRDLKDTFDILKST